MSRRPVNGRMRGHHSLGGALAVAIFIASVATCIFIVAGGVRP